MQENSYAEILKIKREGIQRFGKEKF